MKQVIIIFVIIFSLAENLYSQTDSVYTGNKAPGVKKINHEKREEWKKKTFFGTNFQAQFGSITFIYLSPSIGYIPFKKCNIGVGAIYNYASANIAGYGHFSQSIFGGHSYIRYFLTQNFFAQAQFDKLLQPDWYNLKDPGKKVWVDYALVGAGYSQPIGNLAAFNTSIMYNLTPQALSIYPSQYIIQIGFTARFK